MKTVKELLIEFHLFLLNKRIERLRDIKVGAEILITKMSEEIELINKEGIRFDGEIRGWMKPFFLKEVIEAPKLIKKDNEIIGLALQIGFSKGVDKSIPDYIAYKWNPKYSKYEFSHTVSPAFRYEKRVYPFKQKSEGNFHLAIATALTHLKSELVDLIYDKWHIPEEGILGTIRTKKENYWIASVLENGELKFDAFAMGENAISVTESIDKNMVKDMWIKGLIPKKEEHV